MSFLLWYYNKTEVEYMTSTVDGKQYLVRNMPDKQDAANILADIRLKNLQLSDHLYNNRKKYKEFEEYIELLYKKLPYTKIRESSPNSVYTSYCVDKGVEIVYCIRSKENKKIHDINTIMYVSIHELAHIACPEYNHTPLFKKIYRFFMNIGMELGLYKLVDYSINNEEYCGLILTKRPI
jgi:predicted metal-dependent hydrolase